MFARITVPLDGTLVGDCALPYAVSLARQTGAYLTLLHVHTPFLPGESLEALPQYRFQGVVEFDIAADNASYEQEQARLNELAEQLASLHGVEVSAAVLRGGVVEGLTSYVASSGTDLVVMGTHGYCGALSTWWRSVSDALVRHGTIPVLVIRAPRRGTVRDTAMPNLRRILVPLDGSAFSETILEPVIELAEKLAAQVALFHSRSASATASTASRAPWYQRGDKLVEPQEYLVEVANRFPVTVPLPRTRIVRNSSPVAAVLREVADGAYDLIAMATHGRGGVRHLLWGSTADGIAAGTDLPLLLVRPSALEPVENEANVGAASGLA
jgi:nucleotide-binding universal stress UspA family protein